jgi:Periplasmic component of the Tol biopolymer transport system
VPVAGGAPTPLADAPWAQFAWIGNGSLVYTRDYDQGLYRIGSDGNDTITLTTPDRKKGELGHWWPQVLPDGDHVLFTNYVTPADHSTLEVLSLKTRKRDVVFHGGYFGRYANGHLLFVRNATVMQVPFDAGSLKASGTAVPLPIEIESKASNGWAAFVVSSNGTLVYREDVLKNVALVWSDENGNEEMALDSTARITSAAVSPDNKELAIVRDGDVWIYNRQRGVYTRLTSTEQVETSLVWSPDSKYVLYSRDVPQYDLFKRQADGSGTEQLVVTSKNDKHASAITPDGKSVIYVEAQPGGDDIFIAPFDPADKTAPVPVIQAAGNQEDAILSPDGHWLTYLSTESGRNEAYVMPYPADRMHARQQISTSGANSTAWGRDGRTIYFSSGQQIFKAKFDPQTMNIDKAQPLTKVRSNYGWDIAPDGRFILLNIAGGGHRSLKVVLNWASTLDNISR